MGKPPGAGRKTPSCQMPFQGEGLRPTQDAAISAVSSKENGVILVSFSVPPPAQHPRPQEDAVACRRQTLIKKNLAGGTTELTGSKANSQEVRMQQTGVNLGVGSTHLCLHICWGIPAGSGTTHTQGIGCIRAHQRGYSFPGGNLSGLGLPFPNHTGGGGKKPPAKGTTLSRHVSQRGSLAVGSPQLPLLTPELSPRRGRPPHLHHSACLELRLLLTAIQPQRPVTTLRCVVHQPRLGSVVVAA